MPVGLEPIPSQSRLRSIPSSGGLCRSTTSKVIQQCFEGVNDCDEDMFRSVTKEWQALRPIWPMWTMIGAIVYRERIVLKLEAKLADLISPKQNSVP